MCHPIEPCQCTPYMVNTISHVGSSHVSSLVVSQLVKVPILACLCVCHLLSPGLHQCEHSLCVGLCVHVLASV